MKHSNFTGNASYKPSPVEDLLGEVYVCFCHEGEKLLVIASLCCHQDEETFFCYYYFLVNDRWCNGLIMFALKMKAIYHALLEIDVFVDCLIRICYELSRFREAKHVFV